jgi:hypothetical protein
MGQTSAAWLLDRLADRFGTSHTASAARVRLIDPDTDTNDHNDA